jgi:uncharacterized protein (TIGR02466 family)
MKKFDIHSLFPTPLLIMSNEKGLTDKEKTLVKKYKKESHFDFSHSYTTSNQVLLNKGFKKLKDFILLGIKTYVDNIIIPKNKLNFYITESWINYNNYNDFTHQHSHSNSIISGVYYIETLEKDFIEFLKPKEQIKISSSNYNPYNSWGWQVPVVNDVLVLFPSHLDHNVRQNTQVPHKERISLAFNTFVKGPINDNFSTSLWL